MSITKFAAALALAAALVPLSAQADDPNDPAMQTKAARERDRAMIRKLNRDMLEQVRARDAQYAKGWQAYRDQPARQAEYKRALAQHQRAQAQYSQDRAAYEAKMRQWRRAVELCRAGREEYCGG